MAVTKFDMDFIVATSAQTHQVAVCIRAASVDGQDVVNFFHGCQPPLCKASLAKRMCFDVPCTDALPFSSILLVVVGTALIFVVAVHRLALVLCTVGFVRKIWTAREGARFFRFVRHTALLHSSRKKHLLLWRAELSVLLPQ